MFYALAPLIITILIGLLGLFFVLYLYSQENEEQKMTRDFIKKVEQLNNLSTNKRKKGNKKVSFTDKIKYSWGDRFIQADFLPNSYSRDKAFNLFVGINLLIYLICTFYFKNLGIGIVPCLTIIPIIDFILETKLNSKKEVFNTQIPSFLSMLKSNLQAAETPDRALRNAIDLTESPLYDELKTTKTLSETSTFQNALENLKKTTSNETLKFLANCFSLAAETGGDLEEQVVIIEEIVNRKRALTRQVDIAAQNHKPTILVGMVTIPSMFIYLYSANEFARNYWFTSISSWALFLLTVFVVGTSVYMMNKIIQNLKKSI